MPGNLSVPGAVMSYALCTAFSESRDGQQYHDGITERCQLALTSPKPFKLAQRLTAVRTVALKTSHPRARADSSRQGCLATIESTSLLFPQWVLIRVVAGTRSQERQVVPSGTSLAPESDALRTLLVSLFSGLGKWLALCLLACTLRAVWALWRL
jgi:hypothetical protein